MNEIGAILPDHKNREKMSDVNISKQLIGSSWEIWDFLTKKAGLDPDEYDFHIVNKLCNQLNITLPCKNIRAELKKRNISSEHFIAAFFKTIQPYAEMMTDLCIFFYLHGIKKTNQEMKILFDFGKGPEDLGFDLSHFRETLWRYRQVIQSLSVYGWDYDSLWMLEKIFREFRRNIIRDALANEWLSRYEKLGEFTVPFPSLPLTEDEEIDGWMERVWQVWSTIISECRRYGTNRSDLHQHVNMMNGKIDKHDINECKEESYESLKRCQELPDFKEWDTRTIFVLDSDRWPESVLRGILGFIEKLVSIPKEKRHKEALETLQQIEDLFSSLPHQDMEREQLEKEILDILKLPIWNKRYELYQTWVLTQIDKSVQEYQRNIHHINGSLILSFSGTHISTIETEKGRIHIWGELRSPLAKPIGKWRKSHIQPDYSFTFEPVTDASQTVLAIECKQYKRPDIRNFSEALVDYANGRVNANVLLVNYGDVPQRILERIEPSIQPRTFAIGNFMPNNLKEINTFIDLVHKSLPKPTSQGKSIDPLKQPQYEFIVIDVSGSMADFLSNNRMLDVIQMFVFLSPKAELLAVNTSVVKRWKSADKGLKEFLNIPRSGGTNLPSALASFDLNRAVIFTDNEGWSQMSNMSNSPYLVVELGSIKTLNFHYGD